MTPEQIQQLDLAHDLLNTVKAWPEHVPSWWQLTACLSALEGGAKTDILMQLRDLPLASALAQWFQFSALHGATRDPQYLVRQARLAPALPGAERWMALANLVWWHALSDALDRSTFRQLFLHTGVPALLDGLGRALVRAPRPAREDRKLHRIAILAQHLSTGKHAATALTFNLRALLESAGVATQVFAAQELSLPGMSGHSAGGLVSNVMPMDPATWRLRVPGDVAVTAADVRFSASSRWRSLEQAIDQYDPDAVLFVGFFSPLVWALHQNYPVLGMSVHTLPPLAPVDVWLAADPRPQSGLDWPKLPRPQAQHFPFRFWPSELPLASRGEIGLREDSIVLVSCGARLDSDGLAGWIGEVVRFLEEEPRAQWLVVGLEAVQGARFGQRHPRIRVLPHRTDLSRWIALGDLYLNPPRVGGGASVAMAMEAGVPVVSLAGSDGGDKIGSLAIRDTGQYRARIAEWVADASGRAQAAAQLKSSFRDELDLSNPAAARTLVQACLQARQCFAQRQWAPLGARGA